MYTKKEIKYNLIILYVATALIGFELGLRDFSTTLQILFEKVGGEKLLSLINQFTFYSFILCIFLMGVHVSRYKLKNKIAFMEFLTFFGFFIIAVLMKFDKLSAGILFFIFFGNTIINRFLIIMWVSFKMKLLQGDSFKKLLGNAIFVQMVSIIAGMGVSYAIINKPYPYNFIQLFFTVACIGFAVCILYVLLKEPETNGAEEEIENIKLVEIKAYAGENNFISMMMSKVMYNLSFGVVVLFALYAIKLGYSEDKIVLMGLVSYIFQAISGLIFGNSKTSSKTILLYAHVFTILSIIAVFILNQMFLGFALLGIAEPLVHIGYYGFINHMEGKRKHIYLTSETVINCVCGISVAIFGRIMGTYGYAVSAIISIIFILISILYTINLEEHEYDKTNTNDATIQGNKRKVQRRDTVL